MSDCVQGLPIALIGMRCAGKSSVGPRLARLLDLPFLDLDDELVAAARSDGLPAGSAGELLSGEGLEVFREREAQALGRVLGTGRRMVLATGGGVVERSENRRLLGSKARSVWLEVPAEVLRLRMSRQSEDAHERPALLGEDPLDELPAVLARRVALYRGLAEWVVKAGERSVAELAAQIHATITGEGE